MKENGFMLAKREAEDILHKLLQMQTSCIEQVLEAKPQKAAAVLLPTTHHEKHPN